MTPTEVEILTALTCKVPFFTFDQAARTWWDSSAAGYAEAETVLRGLGRKRFVSSTHVEAHPEIGLDAPLVSWRPGDVAPVFTAVTQAARRRFSERDAATRVFVATPAAARAFGGSPPKLRAASTTHDAHLAAVYLRLLRHEPTRAARWVSEATLAPERTDQVLPDAALLREDGSLELVIEFVGSSYPAERLRNIHLDCEAREVPYELW